MGHSEKITPIIMSGGAGSRLWPASRQSCPKQFLRLVTDKTMLQETVARFDPENYHPPVFICNADHVALIQAQMAEIGAEIGHILIEPVGRNTAACAVMAAEYVRAHADGSLFMLAPADHHIEDMSAFRRVVAVGTPAAQSGALVTFGITPDRPDTGFGYIRKDETFGPGTFQVAEFVEKPDLATAQAYLEGGAHYWNSGIFLFEADSLLREMTEHAPEIATAATAAWYSAVTDGPLTQFNTDDFAAIPSAPIDKAVMEKTSEAVVVPCKIGWHDIGSFQALYDLLSGEGDQAIRGDGMVEGGQNVMIDTDGPLVSVVGVDDVAVIVADGRVMVVGLDAAQDVKKIVERLKSADRLDKL